MGKGRELGRWDRDLKSSLSWVMDNDINVANGCYNVMIFSMILRNEICGHDVALP